MKGHYFDTFGSGSSRRRRKRIAAATASLMLLKPNIYIGITRPVYKITRGRLETECYWRQGRNPPMLSSIPPYPSP
jgi:hypothetical protein